MKTALEIVAILVVILVAGATGVLDDLGDLALICGFGLAPLVVAVLHIYGFSKAAHTHAQFWAATSVTTIAIALLTCGGTLLLSDQIIMGIGLMAGAVAFHGLFLKMAPRYADVFANHSLRLNFVSLPSAPNSRLLTFPMFEVVLGLFAALIIGIASAREHYGIWIYVPSIVIASVGYVFQISHLAAVHIKAKHIASS